MKVICARFNEQSFIFSSVETLEKRMKEVYQPVKITQHEDEGEISYTLTLSDGSLFFVPTQWARMVSDNEPINPEPV